MTKGQNGPLSTKLQIIKFVIGLLIVFCSLCKCVGDWARAFCVTVCEGGAKHKTGRKLEASRGRKLLENSRLKSGTKLKARQGENW